MTLSTTPALEAGLRWLEVSFGVASQAAVVDPRPGAHGVAGPPRLALSEFVPLVARIIDEENMAQPALSSWPTAPMALSGWSARSSAPNASSRPVRRYHP
jgi:hypothetical protein